MTRVVVDEPTGLKVRVAEVRDEQGRMKDLDSHARCDNQIAALKHECGAMRIRVHVLEQELAVAKAAAATADGIAVAVFNAIRNAQRATA